MYDKEAEVEYDSAYNDGRHITGYTTIRIKNFQDNGYTIFDEHIRTLIAYQAVMLAPKDLGRSSYELMEGVRIKIHNMGIFMTTEACWSGYSEYTITNRWTEVVLSIPDLDVQVRFDSIPSLFFRMAEATMDQAKPKDE